VYAQISNAPIGAPDNRPVHRRPAGSRSRSLATELVGAGGRARWDGFVGDSCGGLLMQSWGWGELRRRYGWRPLRILALDPSSREPLGALQVLVKPIGPAGVGWAYAPRGPALPTADEVAVAAALLDRAAHELRRSRVISLHLDPEWPVDDPGWATVRRGLKLRPARYDIQHRNTWLVDLRGTEEEVFRRLPPSTRRNIRTAERAGVEVERAAGSPAVQGFYRLHLETVQRQGFTTRPASYYERACQELGAAVFTAARSGTPLASAIAVAFGRRLIYLYGGTSTDLPQARASYALHWQMIRWGLAQGCTQYDMWGVPKHFDPANPAHGYATFKTRWGGRQAAHTGLMLAPLWGPLDPAIHLAESLALRRRPLLT
jgi:lipid II:glycine glycyltransferase (peptidoglycan interpeptide bridge formation enzyme)